MKYLTALVGFLAVVAPAAARPRRHPDHNVKCPLVLDGRVPANATLPDFDKPTSLFNPDYVKGNNLKWSEILKLPGGGPTRFGKGNLTQPVEVTISDKSIFMTQNGFRRAGLQFAKDSAQDPSDSGVKTIHFSVKIDPQRAFNLSHEYLVSLNSKTRNTKPH